jgi:hypothetical protein
MNASKTMEEETTQTSIFAPFPEPQTMPKGWDVSDFVSKGKVAAGTKPYFEIERKYRYPGIMYD